MLKNKFFFLHFIALCLCANVQGQSIFKNYTVINGLLSNNTYGILQDAKGFIWISSDRGLSRYDGTRFVNYDVTDGLVDNQVINIFYDSKGRIWLNSLNGKFSYIFENKIFSENNDKSLRNNFDNTKAIGAITEDYKGNIHFNIISGNFEYEYDNKTVTKHNLKDDYAVKEAIAYFTLSNNNIVYRVNAFSMHGPNNYFQPLTNKLKKNEGANINTIARSKTSIIYLDSTGVSQLIPRTHIIQLFKYPETVKIENIRTIYYTTNNIWLGLNTGGLYRFALEKNSWVNKGLLYDKVDVNNVYEDREGNFWVSTNYGGIYYLPKFYEAVASLNQLNDNKIVKSFSLKFYNEALWVGAEDYRMYKIENKKVTQSFTINKASLGGNKAYKLLVNDKYLYAGFLNGISQIDKSNTSIQKEIMVSFKSIGQAPKTGIPLKSFVFDKAGKLVISGGVRDYFETDNPLLIERHRPCFTGGRSFLAYTDPLGNTFISTNKGLAKMQDTNYVFLNDKDTVLNEKINTMAFVSEGMYVIGNGTGLHLIKNNKTIHSITDKKLLPGVNCKRSIAKYGQIWMMCDIGVIQVAVQNDKLIITHKFDLRNGLLNEPPVDIEADSSNLYVVTASDIIAINKNITSVLPKTKTLITEFITNGVNRSYEENAVIKEADLPLKISFDLLAFGITENKEFQYRLSANDAWQTISSNSVSLAELNNGKINFEVRGRIGTEEWGDITKFNFEYDKPFYKLRWVQLSALFLSMLFLFFGFQRRQKQQQDALTEKYEMSNKIAALKNQAMQNLMHPHFVFNSLNSIQHYINSNDKENANKYLTRFAKLIRLNLNSGINGFITIEDEIERLQLYLNLEALRFENEITFSIKAHNDIEEDELYLPSMILQPFVENALWHGILPSGHKGHISIYFSVINEQSIKIVVEDNGIGVANSRKQKTSTSHKSKGLSLIKDRLDLLQEKFKKTFSIEGTLPYPENEIQPGNRVTIVIPFLYEDDIK
jgi:ligand-binding sensor domain-containing protein/anti-sigma regulatory factor (Ser/Thr protein kinase)